MLVSLPAQHQDTMYTVHIARVVAATSWLWFFYTILILTYEYSCFDVPIVNEPTIQLRDL